MSKKIRGGFVRRMDYVVSKIVDGKGILLNLDSGAYFGVNPVGMSVWKLCDGKKSAEDISCAVSRKFKTSPERAAKEVRQFIRQLQLQKLVKTAPIPSRSARRN